eukprot:1159271-Pelagomonas_calceolata.AAC.10
MSGWLQAQKREGCVAVGTEKERTEKGRLCGCRDRKGTYEWLAAGTEKGRFYSCRGRKGTCKGLATGTHRMELVRAAGTERDNNVAAGIEKKRVNGHRRGRGPCGWALGAGDGLVWGCRRIGVELVKGCRHRRGKHKGAAGTELGIGCGDGGDGALMRRVLTWVLT